MSVHILYDADQDRSCLFDSVTDTAFGPVVFSSSTDSSDAILHAFLNSFDEDARSLSTTELNGRFDAWHKARQDKDGNLRPLDLGDTK